MKKAAIAAASAAAAATAAASAPAAHSSGNDCRVAVLYLSGEGSGKERGSGTKKDKFAPRFDGLRFIETLVTAHR